MTRFLILAAGVALALAALGPHPPKKGIPYLVHADNLVETENLTATALPQKGFITYIIPGDRSTVRTPLASPRLVIESTAIDAQKLQLFRLEVKSGHREMSFEMKGRGGTVPLRANITKISGTLYQIEAIDTLVAGEYALSPDGSNDVFCFAVF